MADLRQNFLSLEGPNANTIPKIPNKLKVLSEKSENWRSHGPPLPPVVPNNACAVASFTFTFLSYTPTSWPYAFNTEYIPLNSMYSVCLLVHIFH